MSMEAVERAIGNLILDNESKKIEIKNNKIIIPFQDGTVKDKGVIGLQAVDILYFVKSLFIELNKCNGCLENGFTINYLELASNWQHMRTSNRKNRGVEGHIKERDENRT